MDPLLQPGEVASVLQRKKKKKSIGEANGK